MLSCACSDDCIAANASLGFPIARTLTGLVKLADYRSDGFARDTRKLWLQMEWTR